LSPDLLKQLLGGVAPPFALALLLLLPRLRRGDASRAEAGIGPLGALGLGLGTALGSVFLLGGLDGVLRPVSVLQKMAWLALAGGLAGALDVFLGARPGLHLAARVVLRAGVPAAALWWLLGFLRASRFEGTAEYALWIAAAAAAVGLLWSALDLLGALRPGPGLPIAWAASVAVTGGALVAARSASLGQTAGALAAALAALALVALVNRRLAARGAGGPVALALSGLLLAGHFAAQLSAPGALLCAIAPLLPALVELLPLRRTRPFTALVLRVILAVGPALFAAWLAYEPAGDGMYR
jgi:hypothetical protein